jgi:hypothetical protein
VTRSTAARTPTRRPRTRRLRVAGTLAALAAILAVLGGQVLASPPFTAPPSPSGAPTLGVPRAEHPDLPRERRAALGEADGAVPDGTSVFDDGVPGVANLDPLLLGALRRAATDAGNDGVRLVVDSGWRSPAYQEHLLREAVAKYGSEAEARRWVATPGTSAHVSGDAVDVGPPEAARWLSTHGARYGLCQTYANEPWHYELRARAADQGCPPAYADPTRDPRMQR